MVKSDEELYDEEQSLIYEVHKFIDTYCEEYGSTVPTVEMIADGMGISEHNWYIVEIAVKSYMRKGVGDMEHENKKVIRKSHYIDMVEMVKAEFEDYGEKHGVSHDDIGMHVRLEKEHDVDLFMRLLLESGFSAISIFDGHEHSITINKKHKKY